MPRPALSLYRQLPISYKHRSLLLSVVNNTDDEILVELPRITSGFTGVICTPSQLNNLGALRESYLPKIVQLNSSKSEKLECTVTKACQLQASTVIMHLTLGVPSTESQLQLLKAVVTQAQKAKLSIIVQFGFDRPLSGSTRIIMWAYALRLSADYKANFLFMSQDLKLAEIQAIFRISDRDELLIKSSTTPATEIKRQLAGGAKGVVVELSDILTEKDPGQVAYGLGEAVFGPGSYQPDRA